MDPSSPQNDAEPGEGISGLVSEFFDRREAGEDLTPERFADEHPDLAEQLRPYLRGLALFDQARAMPEESSTVESPPGATDLPVIEGYDLIEEIGRGGMGVVYKALQACTKRVVALKVMLSGAFASPTARRRFDREVELAARLEHPSIVQVLESGEVAGQRYYAMGYVAGVRLDRHLADAQPDLHTTLGLFAQICDAVEYAHAHGVIHRDLKPANVLIDHDGNPRILDFGLAKATDEAGTEETLTTYVSLPGQVFGTLFYLSPEQAAGTPDEIDARTDVYALGVILFEALTGSLPFDTTGLPSTVVRRILDSAPIRPSALSDRVDSDLETIILKALEKEKDRRYLSAKELAEDIRRYLAGDPILAKRPSSLYFFRKKLRKHRLVVTLCVVACAVILSAMSVNSWLAHRELTRARWAAWFLQDSLETISEPQTELGVARGLYELYPELVETAVVWAQAQYRSGQKDTAIHFIESQLQLDHSWWARRALLAEMYQAAGETERADLLRAQAERDAPNTAEAWYLRSFATFDAQRALWCAEQAVQREPSHALAWARLTLLRVRGGDLDGALQGVDKLLALGDAAGVIDHLPLTDRISWDAVKGRILLRQGRFDRAIEHFTRAKDYRHRAHAYRRIGEHEKAVADYTTQIECAGEVTAKVWDFYQRATPLWILGRADEALADYRRVRILLGRPSYGDARAFLILRELNRAQEAGEVLDVALREVQDSSWLRQVFRCLAGQVSPDELVADGLTRDNAEQLCEAYYYAGEVCLLSGQTERARQWFELCVQDRLDFDPDTNVGTPMNEFELAQWRLETRFPEAP